MAIQLNPYLHFDNNAKEAMEYYHSVFGGKLTLSTFAEFGMADDPNIAHLIMHGMLEGPDGLTFMGADTPMQGYQPIAGVSMALICGRAEESRMQEYWDQLSDGGQIVQPFVDAPWGDKYGEIVDRFGISWMFNCGDPVEA